MKREIHPLADLIPPMSASEFDELRASIQAEGLRLPITLHTEGRILDGRHRYRACAELGLVPPTETFVGKRRHLDESQRAMVAAKLETMKQGRPGKDANLHVLRADAAEREQVLIALQAMQTLLGELKGAPATSAQREAAAAVGSAKKQDIHKDEIGSALVLAVAPLGVAWVGSKDAAGLAEKTVYTTLPVLARWVGCAP
jgi:hypothetical protein